MSIRKDLTGLVYGRYTVLGLAFMHNHFSYWLCKCRCGAEKSVRGTSLSDGSVVSCGCYNRELLNAALTKHGRIDTREYRAWQDMKRRCRDDYEQCHDYAKRGITVCAEWLHDFARFFADMKECPEGLTLDRKNNSLGYTPDNCRWASREQQVRNRRNNIITASGKLLVDVAKELGMSYDTLYYRYRTKGLGEAALKAVAA